ncbi:MAG: helix-turn-helix transcriptional regulator [Acidimicrobiales bacterium]
MEPRGRCRFVLSPPRHFLFPGLLLLLAERPRHGYRLREAIAALGLGRADRPSIYRALAELEHDGLVLARSEAPKAGSTRRVYAVTPAGEQALEAWMSIVAEERNSLDLVLERYWYCNARRLTSITTAASSNGDGTTAEPSGRPDRSRTRYSVRPARSSLIIEARSNVGPLAFTTEALTGWIEADLRDGLLSRDSTPAAHLDVQVTQFGSGNALYDRELLRRVDARRYPTVSVELGRLDRIGEGNCYRVAGDVTFHGRTEHLEGVITATVCERRRLSIKQPGTTERTIVIAGEQMLDIRRFDLSVPAMPLFKIYPDVRLHLHLEADQPAPAAEG